MQREKTQFSSNLKAELEKLNIIFGGITSLTPFLHYEIVSR